MNQLPNRPLHITKFMKNLFAQANGSPEYFVLIFILVFGILLTLFIPIGAGTDEETHIGRIWEMSSAEFIPNKYLSAGPNYPCAFFETSYYNDPFYTPISWKKWVSQFKIHIDWSSFCDSPTRSRYFPTMYIFQAFIMGVVGRLLDFPVTLIYYLLRFSYVLIYAALGFFTVRKVPFGKWLFVILLLSPTSLFQASTINIDSINNGVSFAFIAWILFLISSKSGGFKKSEWLITLVLSFFITTIKINALPLLLLLLVVPREKFGSKKWLSLFIGLLILFIAVVSLGWNFLASSDQLFTKTEETYDTLSQIRNIFRNPAHFINSYIYVIKNHFFDFLRDWIGVTGYYSWDLPISLYIIYGITLLMTLFIETNKGVLNKLQKTIILVAFLGSVFSTILIFYLSYNDPNELEIPGIYGRYFVYLMPLFLILLIPKKEMKVVKAAWIKAGIIITNCLLVISLFLFYHVDCGNSFLRFAKCELPRYRNWAIDTAAVVIVDHDINASQSMIARCDQLSNISLYTKKDSPKNDFVLNIMDDQNNTIEINNIEVIHYNDQVDKRVYSFQPIDNSKNREFTMKLSITKLPINTEFLYSPMGEYPDGKFVVDDTVMSGDLYFNYECKIGLLELIGRN